MKKYVMSGKSSLAVNQEVCKEGREVGSRDRKFSHKVSRAGDS